MASYNRVIMMGNLTKDPDYKQLTSGQTVCRLALASNRQFKNRQTGSMVQEVCFVDVDIWGPQADSCNQYLQKGSAVLVEGRLKFDTWQDNDGNKRSKHAIVADRVTFLSSANSVSENSSSQQNNSQANNNETKSVSELQEAVKSASAPKRETAASSGEVKFKDEKPFEDDLPF